MSLLRRAVRRDSRSKYSAIPTVIDNIRFASKREAARYLELKLLVKAGDVKDLELQPVYVLMVPSSAHYVRATKVGKYIADFRYRFGPKGILTVEDAKGVKTPLYRLKKKMVEAQYGIRIQEV